MTFGVKNTPPPPPKKLKQQQKNKGKGKRSDLSLDGAQLTDNNVAIQ